MKFSSYMMIASIFVMVLHSGSLFAGYLDDGIKKGGAIRPSSKLELQQNYSFLNSNINAKIARSKAGDKSIKVIDECGTGNINIIGARNSKIKTVINNSNNKGAVSKCKK